MEKLTNKQIGDLLLTKAMSDSVGSVDRWQCLGDVVDEVFENDAIDRDDYLHSIMVFTQLGYVDSDVETEEDIEMSEAVGYEITGLTESGLEYIKELSSKPELKDKVATFFQKFNDVCHKINENPAVKLVSSTIVPMLALFV